MNLLLLDDDIDHGQSVVDHLENHGHDVEWVKLCHQADRALQRGNFHAVVMESELGDGDGLHLLRSWRSRGDERPIIIVSRRSEVKARIEGLRAGADDYLTKPCAQEELAVRLETVGRRCGIRPTRVVKAEAVTLDFDSKTAVVRDCQVMLTAMEWTLLSCLASRAGQTLSREQIRDALFQPGKDSPDSNSMEVIISRVRRKLGPELIHTHRGLGYRLKV